MSEHYPRIRHYVQDDGKHILALRESVSITFYLRRNYREIAPAVLRALEMYCHAIAPHRLVASMNHAHEAWEPLDDKAWTDLHMQVLKGVCISLWLRGEEHPTGFEFFYSGKLMDSPLDATGRGEACVVTFFLPTEYLEEHGAERVRQLALELAQGLPFNSGHAGLVFQGPLSLESIRQEALRHPGLDLMDVQRTSWHIGMHINGVHWLNFLGPPVLGELGGAEGLRSRLHSPGTTVQELTGERAMVTLGPWPEAGDLSQGHTLPAYRELARVLERWLYGPPDIHGFSEEDMRRWQRRFLD